MIEHIKSDFTLWININQCDQLTDFAGYPDSTCAGNSESVKMINQHIC